MRYAMIGMGIFVLIMAVMAFRQGDGALGVALKGGGLKLLKFGPVLVMAFLIMGFLDVLVPQGAVQGWLSEESGAKGMAFAWLAGILTPGGTVIGMPIVAGLYKAGAGIGVLVCYLSSIALLSIIRLPLELGFLGPKLTALRIASCLFLPPIAGYAAQFMARSLGWKGG